MGNTPDLGLPYPDGDGRVIDGDDAMRALAEAVDGMFGGTAGLFVPYVPTFSASAGGGAIGNGVLSGRYFKLGRLVVATVDMTFGSTTTQGAGTFRWAPPVEPAATQIGQGIIAGGRFENLGNNAYGFKAGFVRSATEIEFIYDHAPFLGAGAPFAFGDGDYVRGAYAYEAAS